MKEILNQLIEHRTLSKEQAKEVLKKITTGEFNQSQIAAFLTVYLMRSITVEELGGFREAMMELCIPVEIAEYEAIDLCGTGGDGKDTFNISTLSSFVVAAAGQNVAKHGNIGVSSICGSSNLMAHFGYNFSNDMDEIKRSLDDAGLCFLHAPLFHPAMKNVGPIRKELGVKTFFNMLGPIANPSRPKKQMIGVFSLELTRLYAYLFQNDDTMFSIIHSLDGYDEISLTGDFKLVSNQGEKILSPSSLGISPLDASSISGGTTVQESAKIFEDILRGKGTAAQNAVVIANSAAALQTADQRLTFAEALEKAEDALKSGKALKVFKAFLTPRTSVSLS